MFERRTLAVFAVVLALAAAGCGGMSGEGPITFSASPTTVDDATLDATGYGEVAVTERVQNRTVDVGGRERTVSVTNQLARYERGVDLGPLGSQEIAVFTALTTPEVSVVGQEFNPVADLSEQELAQRVAQRDPRLSVGDRVGNRTQTVLGTEASVETFEGTLEVSGQELDMLIHVTRINHEGDYVVAVGVYPERTDSQERDRLDEMYGGLQHDGDER